MGGLRVKAGPEVGQGHSSAAPWLSNELHGTRN